MTLKLHRTFHFNFLGFWLSLEELVSFGFLVSKGKKRGEKGFLIGEERFREESLMKDSQEEPGPGAYNPQNQFGEKLKRKIKYPKKLKSIEESLEHKRSTADLNTPGPGHYEAPSCFEPATVIEGLSPESSAFKGPARSIQEGSIRNFLFLLQHLQRIRKQHTTTRDLRCDRERHSKQSSKEGLCQREPFDESTFWFNCPRKKLNGSSKSKPKRSISGSCSASFEPKNQAKRPGFSIFWKAIWKQLENWRSSSTGRLRVETGLGLQIIQCDL